MAPSIRVSIEYVVSNIPLVVAHVEGDVIILVDIPAADGANAPTMLCTHHARESSD
jgi:phosphopentomutase